MYVITGATGNVGNRIALELLEKGKNVRVIGRNADKLRKLIEKGAEASIGDVSDSGFVNRAFAGATAVYCMIPPNPRSNDFRKEQQKVARNYANAVKQNEIKYAVLLSSIGAHLRNGAGVVDGLGDMEEYFLELKDVNVINLRAAYFMENINAQLEMIKKFKVISSPIKGDLAIPLVATKDIAQMGAKYLLNLSFKGNQVQFVLGPRDVTYNEIAHVVGESIGIHNLKYVQASPEESKKGMVQSGFASENIADLYNMLSESMNNGKALNAHKRTPENTTPTTLEEFVHVFDTAHSY